MSNAVGKEEVLHARQSVLAGQAALRLAIQQRKTLQAKLKNTPLAEQPDLDPFEFVRMIAAARITMPKSRVRLSAGRQQLGEAVQALCFLAGANSIFYGEKLLITGNPEVAGDRALFQRLGVKGRAGVPGMDALLPAG